MTQSRGAEAEAIAIGTEARLQKQRPELWVQRTELQDQRTEPQATGN